MVKVDLEIVGKTLKQVTCLHEAWSEDEECKCGASLSYCLECYATLQDLEDADQRHRESNLQAGIESWKLATGLIDSSGDPDGITPEHLEARIAELEAEIAKLRTDMAAIEDEPHHGDCAINAYGLANGPCSCHVAMAEATL